MKESGGKNADNLTPKPNKMPLEVSIDSIHKQIN
jgi:hypothetical protein